MKLAGSSSATCALSEVLKSLLHGDPFQCSNEDNTIIFKLYDNSSELDFNQEGTVASLIYSSLLEGKYLNGGMDLGVFDFSKNSTIISSLIQ